jgi:hypothetical protein
MTEGVEGVEGDFVASQERRLGVDRVLQLGVTT